MINHSYLIVDHSPEDVATLERHLNQIPTLKQISTCSSVDEALVVLLTQPCDLLFLEIQLLQKVGIDWLRKLPHRPPTIITTHSPAYAVDCYDLDVVDFLVKPYTTDRLMRAIDRFLTRYFWPTTIESRSIFVYINRRLQRVHLSDITHLEAVGASTKIYTISGEYVTSESISLVETRLPKNQFVRIQKSFIVNLVKVTAVEYRAVWIDSVKLSVGQQFRGALGQFFRGKTKKADSSEVEV